MTLPRLIGGAAVVVAAAAATPAAVAQTSTPAPEVVTMTAAGSVRQEYTHLKDLLTKTAELMPAEFYGFQPTPEMRTFAGSLGHILASNLSQCGALVGRRHARAGEDLAKTLTTRAEALDLVRESFAFCDEFFLKLEATTPMEDAWTSIDGRRNGKPVSFKVSNAANAMHFVAHNNEVYGYLAVYLRLKGIVPPSSAPPPARGGAR